MSHLLFQRTTGRIADGANVFSIIRFGYQTYHVHEDTGVFTIETEAFRNNRNIAAQSLPGSHRPQFCD